MAFRFIEKLQMIVWSWVTVTALITAAGLVAVDPHPVNPCVGAEARLLPVAAGDRSYQVSPLIAALTGALILHSMVSYIMTMYCDLETKGDCLLSKAIFHLRLSSFWGHLLFEVIFILTLSFIAHNHLRMFSLNGHFPSDTIPHLGSSSIWC